MIINPFMFGPAAWAGTFSFVTSAVASATTITVPATAAAGDLGVLFDSCRNSAGTPADATPSGWTNLVNTGITYNRSKIVAKILASGDVGASITGLAGNQGGWQRKIIAIFRPSIAIASFVASTPTAEGTTGNPAAQAISMAAVGKPVIGLAHWRCIDAAATSRSNSPSPTAELASANNYQYGHYMIYNSSPADHTIDCGIDGFNTIMQGVYLTFT